MESESRESHDGAPASETCNIDAILRENPIILGCILASSVVSEAAFKSFSKYKRATLATHIIEELGPAFEKLSPVDDIVVHDL
jgi:hypothetical protein